MRLAAALAMLVVFAPAADAHDFHPGVLTVTELDGGGVEMRFVEPVDSRGSPGDVTVVLPAHCARSGARVDCGTRGLDEVRFAGMDHPRMTVVVVVRRAGAPPREHLAWGDEPRVALDGVGRARDGGLSVGREHVAAVFCLLLMAGARRTMRRP